MTVIINQKKFDRFWMIAAGFLCLLALVFTVIALRTSSWTINEYSSNGEVEWLGLFYTCNRLKCTLHVQDNLFVISTSIISLIFLLCTTISIFVSGAHSFLRRKFYITPVIGFVGVLLLFISIVVYAHRRIINGISARLIIASIILCYISFTIVVFIAGRYSVIYRNESNEFQYTKSEQGETVKKVEEEQPMATENQS